MQPYISLSFKTMCLLNVFPITPVISDLLSRRNSPQSSSGRGEESLSVGRRP